MPQPSVPTVYFIKPGPQNTERTLQVARAGAAELGINQFVVASDTGKSARAADSELVALSGTGFGDGGLDTALAVRTAPSFGGWRVCEILARPRVGPPSEF
jgi:hypothetical protein